MRKVIKYEGKKTYIYPSGKLATPEQVLKDYPAILIASHIIETDENEQMFYSYQNLSAARTMYDIDSSLSEEEAILAIQDILNAPAPEPEPTAEERIASALEYQNLLSMEDTGEV